MQYQIDQKSVVTPKVFDHPAKGQAVFLQCVSISYHLVQSIPTLTEINRVKYTETQTAQQQYMIKSKNTGKCITEKKQKGFLPLKARMQ